MSCLYISEGRQVGIWLWLSLQRAYRAILEREKGQMKLAEADVGARKLGEKVVDISSLCIGGDEHWALVYNECESPWWCLCVYLMNESIEQYYIWAPVIEKWGQSLPIGTKKAGRGI